MPGSGPRRRQGPPQRRGSRAPLDPARLAAYEVVKAVRVEDAYANLVLPHVLARLGLGGRDAAFATELASGTLRLRGLYDAVLAACVDRPLAKVEAKVLDLLRLGTHQLLSMRVPSHAAIATTVDLVTSKVGPGAGGFANAVLRKVAGRSLDAWVAAVAPDAQADPVGHLAIAASHPRWQVELLDEALHATGSAGPTELADLLSADNDRPRVVLVARPGRVSTTELLAEAPGGSETGHSPYGVVLAGGNPMAVPAVADGRAGVQDEGSQLVALAVAEAALDEVGERTPSPSSLLGDHLSRRERWLDLCAGPGGKAALLAALAAERDAVLVANERQPHRAGLVRGNLALHGAVDADEAEDPGDAYGALVPGVVGVVAADGTRPPFRAGTFDRVLVDAPCSGLGALRRRPEARWRRRPADVDTVVPLQRELLRSALDLVRPGGVVVYATCSPVMAETRDVVAAVLAEDPTLTLEPVGGHAGGVPDAAGPMPGTVQLWPHRHGTDAMFIAVLRRA